MANKKGKFWSLPSVVVDQPVEFREELALLPSRIVSLTRKNIIVEKSGCAVIDLRVNVVIEVRFLAANIFVDPAMTYTPSCSLQTAGAPPRAAEEIDGEKSRADLFVISLPPHLTDHPRCHPVVPHF